MPCFNVMGIFKRTMSGYDIERQETPIYGSTRLGVAYKGALHTTGVVDTLAHHNAIYTRALRQRGYELTDHLGNVRATVSDMLIPRGGGVFDADLRTLTDYYPFGMQMPERTYEAAGIAGHRYGYGGHERVDEVSGDANMVDMGDRWLDVRTARTPKTDAKEGKYPFISPYTYGLNNPASVVDIDGKDVYLVVWRSKEDETGHSAIAVDNYKKVVVRTQQNGKEVTKTEWVKDGTVTYYDLWPAMKVDNTDLQKNVQEDYNKRVISSTDLLTKDVSVSREVGHVSQYGEGRPADGVVRITSDYSSDQRVKSKLDGIQSSGKDYNGCHFNCSTFAQEGLRILEPKLDASQKIEANLFMQMIGLYTARAVAPNNLFNAATTMPGATVMKGPQKMDAKPFLEYFGK